jgi:xanthine dehydrogenase molybdenum-binding subunit
MAEEFSVIGKSVSQKDGMERVTGRAKYYGDVILPNMLHMKILRSPYAQADIMDIDTHEAETFPGVALVMSFINFPQVFRRDVHYVGDEVAAVVAIDEETAEEACDLIKVNYNPKPFVIDMKEAMKPDAPQIFPDRPNVQPGWGPGFKFFYFTNKDPVTGLWNQREPCEYHGFGDVEQGFMEADVIVEDSDLSQGYSRVTTMESRGSVSSFENGRLTIWTHSQGLHILRNDIAKFFKIPRTMVNLVSPYTGGSFGGKVDKFYIPIAATFSLNKPVKLVFTREEEMLRGWARGSLSRAKLGFKKDGRLTTMEVEHWVEVGPYGDLYPVRNIYRHTLAKLYARNAEHLKITAGVVFTNRFISIGWHGYGTPEANFLVETVMDEAAYVLGIDPVELRRINHFRKGDPVASPRSVKVSSQMSSCGLKECLDEGIEKSGWKKYWRHPNDKKGIVREGHGMDLVIHGAGDGLFSSAIVKAYPDATVSFECGIADIGQGQHTVQCQIVAETIGIPYENVHLVCQDTDSVPYATRVGGSQGTWHQGKATYDAALSAKKKILELAGARLGKNPEELTIRNGSILTKGCSDPVCTFVEAFGDLPTIIGVGQTFPDGREEGIYPREQGAHFVRLSVNTETGEINIHKYVPVQYVGRALNPKIVEGQIFSGVYHGLECALLAECIVDRKTGKMLTYNWENYKPLTMLDCDIEPAIVEIPGIDHSHPYGAIACGEGAVDAVCAAMGNAIFNATGVRLKKAPFTPDRLLKALGKI